MFVVHLLGKATSRGDKETKPHSLRGLIRALLTSVTDVSQQNHQGNWDEGILWQEPHRIYFQPILQHVSHWPGHILEIDIPLAFLTPCPPTPPKFTCERPGVSLHRRIFQQCGLWLSQLWNAFRGMAKHTILP